MMWPRSRDTGGEGVERCDRAVTHVDVDTGVVVHAAWVPAAQQVGSSKFWHAYSWFR